MAEQLRKPFEKFVDWRQDAGVMLLCLPLHKSGALQQVHELFKRPSYIGNVTDRLTYWKTGWYNEKHTDTQRERERERPTDWLISMSRNRLLM
jgi:hypothetical protein